MSEQKMPARIWVGRHTGWAAFEMRGDTAYIKADIAERMAEALEKTRDVITFSVDVCFADPTGSWLETLNRIDSALSAFRSAKQDTEARHD